jgi:branched-chain amino acid transport system substrate-binding protein
MSGSRKWPVLVVLALIVLSACAPPAPKEVEVTTVVEVTKEVVKEVEVMITPTPLPEPAVVKIGALYPLSGPAAATGVSCRDGVALAMEIINGEYDFDLPLARSKGLPNLGNAQIELRFADHTGDPSIGKEEAERLVTREEVVALIGPYYSSVADTASTVAERYGVPFVCPDAIAYSLGERGYEWFFRTCASNKVYVKNFFDMLEDINEEYGLGLKTIGLLNEETLAGAMEREMELELAPEYGFEVVVDITYPEKASDVAAEVARIRAADPDVLIQLSYVSDAILFHKQYREQNWLPKVFIVSDAGHMDPSFLEAVGSDGDFLISRVAWAADLAEVKPMIAEVNEVFRALFGRDFDERNARSFTGMMVLADAVNRAGSTEPEAIRKALLEADIPEEQMITAWGVKFDPETGENIKAVNNMAQTQDGKWVTVWPFELAPAEIAVPVPSWEER